MNVEFDTIISYMIKHLALYESWDGSKIVSGLASLEKLIALDPRDYRNK